MNTIMLGPGTYIIVDPCYVMPDKAYQAMINTIWSTNHDKDDQYTYKGKEMVIFSTAYGDGSYPNSFNNNGIAVDSGLIAIIPVDVLSKKAVKDAADHSAVATFEYSFTCTNSGGNMTFGHIEVNTCEDEDDEEDEWYNDDDEDDDEDY